MCGEGTVMGGGEGQDYEGFVRVPFVECARTGRGIS